MRLFDIKRVAALILAVLLFVGIIPQNVFAGIDTNKTNTNKNQTEQTITQTQQTQTNLLKEKNFNKKKTVTIPLTETYKQTKQFTWISYKAKADGYLTVTAVNVDNIIADGCLALYNETKTVPLSSKSIAYNGIVNGGKYWTQTSFGLKKGQKYYIRVKAYTPVKLSCSFKKLKDKSGVTLDKALTIKKNKSKKGLLLAGDVMADWYKFKLSKKAKKIKIIYNIHAKGNVRLSIYCGKKCLASKVLSYSYGERQLTVNMRNSSTDKRVSFQADTYYLKVESANGITSGYYSLKWK